MRMFLFFLLFMFLAVIVLLLTVLLGARGAWYFAWMIGTVMLVLISALGGALLDAQEAHAAADGHQQP